MSLAPFFKQKWQQDDCQYVICFLFNSIRTLGLKYLSVQPYLMQYPEGHVMDSKPSILFPAILSINHLHETINRKQSRKFRVRRWTFSVVCIVLYCVVLSSDFWLRHTLHAYVCVCQCLSALQGHVQKCHPDPLSQWLHCLGEGSITAWICIQMITNRSDLGHCNDKCWSIVGTRCPEYGCSGWIRQGF